MEQDRRKFLAHSLALAAAPIFRAPLRVGRERPPGIGVIGTGGAAAI